MSTGSGPPPFSMATGARARHTSSASLLSPPVSASFPAHSRGLRADRASSASTTSSSARISPTAAGSIRRRGNKAASSPRPVRSAGGEFPRHGGAERLGGGELFRRPAANMRAVATMGLVLVVGVINYFRPETQRQRLALARGPGGADGDHDHRSEQRSSEHRAPRARARESSRSPGRSSSA